jgi:hypothetical protein
VLALLGDVKGGDELGKGILPGSPLAEQYAAVKAWRAGDPSAAAAMLARAEAADPWPNLGLAPSYLLAELSAATGDDMGTIAAVERFHRLPPDRIWRAWAYPRSLLLSAEAHAHIGDLGTARAEVDRLLALLAHADPGLQLALRGRALRRRLS